MEKTMKKMVGLVFFPISLAIIAEFLLKISVSNLPPLTGLESLPLVLTKPGIFIGVGLLLISGLLWLVALSKFEMSFIYPFLSINYVAIMLGSKIFLGEDLALSRIVAMCLIIIGLFLISRSPYSESTKE